MRRVLDEHFGYVADAVRLDAYRRALDALVTPGAIVLDLGSGTGVLGLLACRAGARRVYAVESSGLIDVARRIARDNGCADRITHIRGWLRDVALAERANLLVCDQLGPLGFDGGILDECHDAATRLLGPAASLIPSRVESWLAPVEAATAATAVDRWTPPRAGFTFEAMREKAANTAQRVTPGSERLLAEARAAFEFVLGAARDADVCRTRQQWTVERPGVLHGLLGWFVAQLAPGIAITNGPGPATRIDRPALLLPFDKATAVEPGDIVDAEIVAGPPRRFLVWRVRIDRAGRELARFEHTSLRGLLVSSEDLTSPR